MIRFVNSLPRARRAALAASILMALSSFLHAQPDGGPGGGPSGGGPGGGPPGDFGMDSPSLLNVNNDLKKLTKLLSLTTDQQTQVKAILTDERTQMQATIKKAESADRSDGPGPGSLWIAVTSIRQGANSKIAALLNGDQAQKFAAWQKKQEKEEMESGPDGGPPPDGGGPPPGGGPPGI